MERNWLRLHRSIMTPLRHARLRISAAHIDRSTHFAGRDFLF
jgi:hypothetical protein